MKNIEMTNVFLHYFKKSADIDVPYGSLSQLCFPRCNKCIQGKDSFKICEKHLAALIPKSHYPLCIFNCNANGNSSTLTWSGHPYNESTVQALLKRVGITAKLKLRGNSSLEVFMPIPRSRTACVSSFLQNCCQSPHVIHPTNTANPSKSPKRVIFSGNFAQTTLPSGDVLSCDAAYSVSLYEITSTPQYHAKLEFKADAVGVGSYFNTADTDKALEAMAGLSLVMRRELDLPSLGLANKFQLGIPYAYSEHRKREHKNLVTEAVFFTEQLTEEFNLFGPGRELDAPILRGLIPLFCNKPMTSPAITKALGKCPFVKRTNRHKNNHYAVRRYPVLGLTIWDIREA